ncbi:MAG: lytic transglycosylase domain-containing protein [Nocardioidaceae bacterium]
MFGVGLGGQPRRATRWQRAAVLLPLVVLTGVWSAHLASNGSGNPDPGTSQPTAVGLPDVPTTPFEQPASLALADATARDGTISALSASGIPSAALFAYRRAAQLVDRSDPRCHVTWALIAAVGRVESNHGRSDGNILSEHGIARPGIFGPPLNGANGSVLVRDTDDGALDHDTTYDRAVGPMQFVPSAWYEVGTDVDGDGVANPQDVYDAATGAGVYLCAGDYDLATAEGQRAAVYNYNHSDGYVTLVLSVMDSYLGGDYTTVPNGIPSSPVVVTMSTQSTQTVPPGNGTGGGPSGGGSGAGGTSGTGGTGGGGTGGGSGGGGGTGGGGGSGGGGSGGGGTGGGGGGPADPVNDTLDTIAEATTFCENHLNGTEGVTQAVIDDCANQVLGKTTDEATQIVNDIIDALLGGILGGLGL